MVNQFVREGIADEKLQELIKDNPRPQNCEGLFVKNKSEPACLEYHRILPPHTRSADVASQNMLNSLIKGATILTKLSNNGDTSLVESGLDVLALLGQANKQLVQRGREALKPVIQSEIGTSVPYTDMLFGDDVSKNGKDIQDMERLKKMVPLEFLS